MRAAIGFVLLLALAVSVFATHAQYQYTRPMLREYPTQMCQSVEIAPAATKAGANVCYQNAMRNNKRLNTGLCFQQVARKIRDTCFANIWTPHCLLQPGFEKGFHNRNDCVQGIDNLCMAACGPDPKVFEVCKARSRVRCSYLGRFFV